MKDSARESGNEWRNGMTGEERITPKAIKAHLLPQVTKMRCDLEASLVSLRYLWEVVDGHPEGWSEELGHIHDLIGARTSLEIVEYNLCRV